MQHTSHSILVAVLASMLVSCGTETSTPTQAQGSSDEVAAAMVALAVGQESNGFAAMVDDAAAVTMQPAGREEAAGSVSVEAPMAAWARDLRPDDRFVRRIERDNVVSEWRMSYSPLLYGSDSEAGAVEVRSDGTFRSQGATMQGEATGTLDIRRKGVDDAEIIGAYAYNGSISFTGAGNEAYSAVRILFTWNRLRLDRGDGKNGGIVGMVDVSISANGPQGIMSKNGRMTLDGTNRALLTISGGEFSVDVRRGLKR